MRYLVLTFLGMALFAFCWVAVGYGIYQMLQIGTCASGGPYVSARQCPDGTEAIVFALIGGILGLFVAAGIYIGRGKPPGSARAAAERRRRDLVLDRAVLGARGRLVPRRLGTGREPGPRRQDGRADRRLHGG